MAGAALLPTAPGPNSVLPAGAGEIAGRDFGELTGAALTASVTVLLLFVDVRVGVWRLGFDGVRAMVCVGTEISTRRAVAARVVALGAFFAGAAS